MKRILILLAVVSAFVIVTCVTAAGQGATAQISGTVKDQSGAVLPGAEITATQTETGTVRMTLSDETGSYVLPNLPVGPYKLEVSLAGFRTFVQSGIVLQVNSSTVVNAVLNVGQVSETVEVQANAALVETRSTGIGQVVENARILELPLIGRQVTDLISINGAALPVQTTDTTYRGTYPNTTGFSIAGGLLGGNTYTLDGGMHNDVYANYGLPLPFPDALQEFKVETSSLPAQYGFHSGGAVNAVTRSGTNDFHGSLFEFVRNYAFNARNFFAPTRDGLKRNQYGGTIGGPIKKNKLFFFAGYQGTITRQSPQSTFSFVPTAEMIAGDFTTYASRACQGRDLGVPFVNNRLAPSQISPAAVNIAKRLPAAVDQCGRTSWGNPVASDEYFPIG
ncbi:MAG: TonB-dependent receptor, partial [Acidobacteria bacterium]